MAIIDVSQDVLSGVDKEQARTFWDVVQITSASNTITAGTQADVFTATSSKNLTNSNLSQNSMLPIQFSAVIYRFRCQLIGGPASVASGGMVSDDIALIQQYGVFQFYRNQNELVYEVPLMDLGAGGGVAQVTDAALTTGMVYGSNFAPNNLDQIPALPTFGQISIAAGMSFRGLLTWSDAVTLASSNDSFELRMLFDCKLMKPVS